MEALAAGKRGQVRHGCALCNEVMDIVQTDQQRASNQATGLSRGERRPGGRATRQPKPQASLETEYMRLGCLVMLALLIGVPLVIWMAVTGGTDSSDRAGEATSSTRPLGPDDAFLSVLATSAAFDGYEDAALIRIGREVCVFLDGGGTWSGIGATFFSEGWSGEDAGLLAGAAIGSYCPEYEYQIP